MNLCWITIRVNDIKASLHFYHEILGLKIATRHEGSGMDMIMLGEGAEPKIELLYLGNQPPATIGSGVSIGLQVPSLDSAMRLMQQNDIPILRGPVAADPYTSFFFVNDPDGVTVQFVELKSKKE